MAKPVTVKGAVQKGSGRIRTFRSMWMKKPAARPNNGSAKAEAEHAGATGLEQNTLKPGDQVTMKVFALVAAPRVIPGP
jgi:hypothetical protein